MPDYDVIIVGGGPAGSTTARGVAQSGLSILLVDKETFPRAKPCAGGVIELVRHTLDFSIDEVVQREVYGHHLFSPSGLMVDTTQDEKSGCMVMRSEFDDLLLRKARDAGAEVREDVRIDKALQDSNGVTVTTSQGESISAKYLVGADGINSTVAKEIGFYDGWKKDSAAVCIEVEAEVGEETVERICGVPFDKDGVALHIYFGKVPHGYIWCFPKRSILSLGAGCRQDLAKNMRSHFTDWLEQFKRDNEVELEIISDTSARIPYSGAAKKTVLGRTLIVGDAAGFVSPFSGEGLSMAVMSGIHASTALEQANQRQDPRLLRMYEKDWKRDFGDNLKVGKSLAKLMFKSEKNMETILRLGYDDEHIREIMYRMIAGLHSYRSLRNALVKRILRKHPRAGLSLYV
ncbi:MAG: geranylgeranyl reductase family protein [Candidatus Thorarchaeota archaeon]|nr:MAG: geranylgeranyl reductase family protein [Candidatus Thorarchaeota archaeon]